MFYTNFLSRVFVFEYFPSPFYFNFFLLPWPMAHILVWSYMRDHHVLPFISMFVFINLTRDCRLFSCFKFHIICVCECVCLFECFYAFACVRACVCVVLEAGNLRPFTVKETVWQKGQWTTACNHYKFRFMAVTSTKRRMMACIVSTQMEANYFSGRVLPNKHIKKSCIILHRMGQRSRTI